jgi:hypothetical protein
MLPGDDGENAGRRTGRQHGLNGGCRDQIRTRAFCRPRHIRSTSLDVSHLAHQ